MNKHKTVLSKRMIISEGEKEKTNKQTNSTFSYPSLYNYGII